MVSSLRKVDVTVEDITIIKSCIKKVRWYITRNHGKKLTVFLNRYIFYLYEFIFYQKRYIFYHKHRVQ